MDIVNKSVMIPKSEDGIRRSVWAVIRNTDRQLSDTTIPSFLRMFPDGAAGVWHERDFEFLLEFKDVHSTIKFRCLDKTSDQRRVLSMNLTAVYLNEFREIKPVLFEAIDARAGRFQPSLGGWFGLIGDSNPPDEFTYWANILEKRKQPGYRNPLDCEVFWQPSGLADDAENVENLRPNYYSDLADGKGADWVDVHIHAKLGKQQAGSAVYSDSFNRKLHVGKVQYDALSPVYIGMDFGLLPAMVVGQLDECDRLKVLASVTTDRPSGIEQMMKTRGIAMLRKVCPLTAYRDIHLFTDIPKRSESDMKTAYDALKQIGFTNMRPGTVDNRIDSRLSSVRRRLTTLVGQGQPKLIFSDSGLASSIISATEAGYTYKKRRYSEGEFTGNEPEKNSASHVSDALQYLCLGVELYGNKIRNIYSGKNSFGNVILYGDRLTGY